MEPIAELWRKWDVVGASILVVDDDPDYAFLLREYLIRTGASRVSVANTLEEATSRYEAERPEIAIVDYHLEGHTGIEVIRALRAGQQFYDELPIVMQTGSRSADIRREAMSHFVTDFVLKDTDPTEMLLRVGKALRTHRLARQVRSENQRLEQAVAERTAQLARASEEIFERLVRAAALRDEDTADHTGRVGRTTCSIALALGIDPGNAEVLGRAAELHDIGKIGIPDAILLKPGPLTPDERKTMESHAALGAALLEGGADPILRIATTIAMSHHERWDGNGYPCRLSGMAIPIGGRIVAVADAYDAMTQDRPYRRAMPRETARQILREGAGSQWDSTVVDAFFRVLAGESGVPICESYAADSLLRAVEKA